MLSKRRTYSELVLNALTYATIIALTVYAVTLIVPELPAMWIQGCTEECELTHCCSSVVANALSYAIFLVLMLLFFLALENKRLLIVPFLLGTYRILQSLALYYVSSKTYSIESLGLLLNEIRYSIDLLHTAVFSTSMAELITLLLLALYLIVISDRFRKRLLLAPLALIILSMLFIASFMSNIFYAAYVAALFTLAIILIYLLRERKNVIVGVFKGKTTILGATIILLLSILNAFLICTAPSTLTTNYKELLAEKPYTISLSKLRGCFWGGKINRTCWTAHADPHSSLICFNESYKICKFYLTTTKLTLHATLLISNSSERALVVSERDSSYNYALTSVLNARGIVAYEFIGFGDSTLHHSPDFLFSEDIFMAWNEIASYMDNKFGALSLNLAAVGFHKRISRLFSSFMRSWSNGKGPLLFKPKPLVIYMFDENSSITLVYFNEIDGDVFLLKITY